MLVADTDFIRDFGVRSIPWEENEYDLIQLKLNNRQYIDCLIWILSHIGIEYDNKNNLRYLFGKKSNGDIKLNCVESIIDMLCDIGYLSKMYRDMNLSPTQLYDMLKKEIE